MPEARRIFISHSHQDDDLVHRLQEDLRREGMAVWLDHESLLPGADDWQSKIRESIERSTTMIYVASEAAARSIYVTHEIGFARGEGKIIIPFWIRGEKWSDCAPLGHFLTQYIDGRGAAYSVGLRRLMDLLISVPPSISAASAAPAALARAPLPGLPARLASHGYYGVNSRGVPAILPPLVSVAAGPFIMGSSERDALADKDEKPQQRVDVAAFQIARYPVTVAEYALAVRAGATREPPPVEKVSWERQRQRSDHPVVCVSWQDATEYTAWLRAATGEDGWRLPTEAEWEKAARWDAQRGVSHLYPWGDSFDNDRCNTSESGIKTTTPIGSYPVSDPFRSGASPCGAEDMAGNVWEWTDSLYKPYPYSDKQSSADKDPVNERTMRGGSWFYPAWIARAACRLEERPDFVCDDVGFRLILAKPGP